jgi:hypothetical protein
MDAAKTSATSVDQYNPAEGLAKIAQAEGVEGGYRRARNLEGLRNALI